MSLLIINTLEEDNPAAREAVACLTSKVSAYQIIQAGGMKISPCIGCNACWLRTPGRCALKDDYEQILKAFLQYRTTIFIADTALGFISHRMKNIADRMLPLATMYTRVENGQMRHIPRYENQCQLGLVYSGTGDREYIGLWLSRAALNFNGRSIGVYPVEQCGEAALCI